MDIDANHGTGIGIELSLFWSYSLSIIEREIHKFQETFIRFQLRDPENFWLNIIQTYYFRERSSSEKMKPFFVSENGYFSKMKLLTSLSKSISIPPTPTPTSISAALAAISTPTSI
jgi:hypothetical protein